MDSILIFIVVLGVLIFFHELGHFLVARLFGVGVERFSLGFGPKIIGKTIGRTDYRISLIPLGGYVKMIGDDPEAPLDPDDVPVSFTHKHVAKRSLIVAAGPLFNILLAILIFTGSLYFYGMTSIKPVIRSVDENSPAQKAGIQEGDFVLSIDGQAVQNWQDINAILENNTGQPLQIRIKRNEEVMDLRVDPQLESAKNIYGEKVSYYDIGIKGFKEVSPVVEKVVKGLPADQAGIKSGDEIVAINDRPITRWETMQEMVAASQGNPLEFEIRRENQTFAVEITPEKVQERDLLGAKQTVYRIGIHSEGIMIPESDRMVAKLGLVEALRQGLRQTWFITSMTGEFFVKLVQQKVPKEAIGGPIRIAQMAQKEAKQGVLQLINFIGIISVSLAIFNLVPIPVLDGGHLLFFAIEAVQRKPVSIKTREKAQQIGVFLLVLLLIFVFYNDIAVTFF